MGLKLTGTSKRRLLGLILLTLILSPGLMACQSPTEVEPSPATTSVPSGTATAAATASPTVAATQIPDLGLVDAADRQDLDIVRDDDLNASGHYEEIRVAEDGTRHLIPLDAVEWGGVARDGIPSLDVPSYVGPDRWSQMVYDPEGLVIGIEVNGKYRAYPLQILIWHEIVNETFEDKHLLVTY